jgi:hypothetical protein
MPVIMNNAPDMPLPLSRELIFPGVFEESSEEA